MKELYIANLIKKEKICEGVFICKVIGPIVGLLFGSHFLSSHNKKYIPMFTKVKSLEGNQFCKEIDFSKETFFQTEEEYAYYELKRIENYDTLEVIIEEYKKKYDKMSYFIDFTTQVPVFIRYKEKLR